MGRLRKALKLFELACLGLLAVDAVLDIAEIIRDARCEPECEGCLGCCFEEDPAMDKGAVANPGADETGKTGEEAGDETVGAGC